MSAFSWLAIYCSAILLASLLGGSLPLAGRLTHGRLQLYLSLSAGVMLGASFFHVMPEAMEMAGSSFGWWISVGVVGLFCIERFIAPHSHEVPGAHNHEHHSHDAKHEHGAAGHKHDHDGHDRPAAAPPVAGWAAVLGLTIHTFMNGVGLAGEVQVESSQGANAAGPEVAMLLPGLAMFLAIVLHKPADALAISTVLTRKGISIRRLGLVQLGFALMVPVGALAFHLTEGAITKSLQTQVTGAALAFSAGTFLLIALSDLLPEVQFHRHDRLVLFLALVLGVVLMGGIALLEDAGHGHEGHEKEAQHEAMEQPGHQHHEKEAHDEKEAEHRAHH